MYIIYSIWWLACLRNGIINKISDSEISILEMRFQFENWYFNLEFQISIWEVRFQFEKWDFNLRIQNFQARVSKTKDEAKVSPTLRALASLKYSIWPWVSFCYCLSSEESTFPPWRAFSFFALNVYDRGRSFLSIFSLRYSIELTFLKLAFTKDQFGAIA